MPLRLLKTHHKISKLDPETDWEPVLGGRRGRDVVTAFLSCLMAAFFVLLSDDEVATDQDCRAELK